MLRKQGTEIHRERGPVFLRPGQSYGPDIEHRAGNRTGMGAERHRDFPLSLRQILRDRIFKIEQLPGMDFEGLVRNHFPVDHDVERPQRTFASAIRADQNLRLVRQRLQHIAEPTAVRLAPPPVIEPMVRRLAH